MGSCGVGFTTGGGVTITGGGRGWVGCCGIGGWLLHAANRDAELTYKASFLLVKCVKAECCNNDFALVGITSSIKLVQISSSKFSLILHQSRWLYYLYDLCSFFLS